MKIAVIGLGYVGITVAVGLALEGHTIRGYDIDSRWLRDLSAARLPIREAGLDEALGSVLADSRLQLATSLSAAVDDVELIFLCVGTPPGPGGRPDLTQVLDAVDTVAAASSAADSVLVLKSTVPPGTAHLVQARLADMGAGHLHVASNPEFLREGMALRDLQHPARIIIGTDSALARTRLEQLFAPQGAPILFSDPTSAEIIKYGSNAFLATRLSFVNILADLCDVVGGDIEAVTRGIGLDPRIGSAYFASGAGYGGSCLPKDVDGLIDTLQGVGLDPAFFAAVRSANEQRADRLLARLRRHVPDLSGARVAVLGLAFKPETDDVREAPSIRVVAALRLTGACIRLHDPWAASSFERIIPADPPEVSYAPTAEAALRGADAAVLVTEWPEYRQLTPAQFRQWMRSPVLVDGRNLFDPAAMGAAGIRYESVGRPFPAALAGGDWPAVRPE